MIKETVRFTRKYNFSGNIKDNACIIETKYMALISFEESERHRTWLAHLEFSNVKVLRDGVKMNKVCSSIRRVELGSAVFV